VSVGRAAVATPIGRLLVETSDAGVTHVERVEGTTRIRPTPGTGPAARHLEDARRQLHRYFEGRDLVFTVPVDLGDTTPFRRSVLETLQGVPPGITISYGELAALAGHPGAMRAVGSTMAANPVAIVIPCHRVVRAGGALGSYGVGGTEVKRWLLDHEGALDT
jgi:methylated-DNA-[protein]-cysteine S-methyltransferase